MSSEPGHRIRRALISVSNKAGIENFAAALEKGGVRILSTGGTAANLSAAGISVTDVSEYTQFPEVMGGRVKTLHPKIHGGILGRMEVDEQVMQKLGIDPIDLVVVNLYPFAQTIAKPDCSLVQAIENIDIGGPAMIRAAAKNYDRVGVVVDPGDYDELISLLQTNQWSLDATTRFSLARKAFSHTAEYDGMIANYLGIQQVEDKTYPPALHFTFYKKQALRYGENPHQTASFYNEPRPVSGSIAAAKFIQGKELSFNNIADTDAALNCVKQFSEPACVIVKHANPCGVAVANTITAAYQNAYKTDPTSAFGGIIAFNRALDIATAKLIFDQQFVEVIIAPGMQAGVEEVLQTKPNTRVLDCVDSETENSGFDLRRVSSGILVQDHDNAIVQPKDLDIVSQRKPSQEEIQDLLFAWKIVKFVKSNAIVYARDQQTVGIGAGQMSRVYSAKIAGIKAADEKIQVHGAVMASDAFFPFRDGIDTAYEAGISAVIQPGGSRNDEEVIAAANEHGMAMAFTGIRHFRH